MKWVQKQRNILCKTPQKRLKATRGVVKEQRKLFSSVIFDVN